jgi:hypothetical protein
VQASGKATRHDRFAAGAANALIPNNVLVPTYWRVELRPSKSAFDVVVESEAAYYDATQLIDQWL